MVGPNGDCLGKVRTRMSAEGDTHYSHRGNENNSNKSIGDALGSANSRSVGGVFSTGGRIWPTKPHPRNLGIGHNRIWANADKVDSTLQAKIKFAGIPQSENCIRLTDSSPLKREKCPFIGAVVLFSENSIL